MHGNVWEWTRSAYMPYPYSDIDGRNETDEKKKKGGTWWFVVRPSLSCDFFIPSALSGIPESI